MRKYYQLGKCYTQLYDYLSCLSLFDNVFDQFLFQENLGEISFKPVVPDFI